MNERRAKRGGRDRISTKSKLADELAILGAVLVRTREQRGLKQSDIAASLQLPASWLSKIETGSRRLDPIELIRLAEAMDVDPCDLIREIQKDLSAVRNPDPSKP